MGVRRTRSILFPVGGLDRGAAYQQQPPYTTPDAVNVRPSEGLEDRTRGGSRPGLIRAYPNAFANPIRLLNSVRTVSTTGATYFVDQFEYATFPSTWSAASWWGSTLPTINAGKLDFPTEIQTKSAAIYQHLDLQASTPYDIDLNLTPEVVEGGNDRYDGIFSIFARMDNTTPVGTTDGIVAQLTTIGGSAGASLTYYISGVATTVAGSSTGTEGGEAIAGTFRLRINGTSTKIFWVTTTEVELLSTTVPTLTGERFGFGLQRDIAETSGQVDGFRVVYTPASAASTYDPTNRTQLVVSAGGNVYVEDVFGTIAQHVLDTGRNLSSTRLLNAVDRLQKLYIADYGDVIARGTDGVVAGATNFTAASVPDWTVSQYDLDVKFRGYAVDAGTSGSSGIASVSGGTITTTNPLTDTPTGPVVTVTWNVQRGPKIYDPSNSGIDALTVWNATAGFGSVPVGCPLICLYRDRLVLAGAPPQVWYMSKQGDPLDWDFDTTAGSAVAATNSNAGRIGEPIHALMPHGDDYLIFGCFNSLWVLRGDPTFGGQIDALSYTVSVVSAQAHCTSPEGHRYILSRDGVYRISAGAGLLPEPMSRGRLPQELIGIDPNIYIVTMSFDTKDWGLHIYLTTAHGGALLHWFVDLETFSFWPVSLDDDHAPTALYDYHSSLESKSALILGGQDGYLRKYSPGLHEDDGIAFDSSVLYGPLRAGGNAYQDGAVVEVIATLDVQSSDVTWSILPGDSAEQARTATALASGTWSGGRNPSARPRVRAPSFFIKVEGFNGSWAMDELLVTTEAFGQQRLRA